MFLHPSDLTLTLFAASELAAPRRQRVARHLARCERCFTHVARIREISALAGGMPTPRVSDDSLTQINVRRTQGEGVLLGNAEVDPPRHVRSLSWPVAAVAAALLLAVGILSTAPRLAAVAADSELTLTPVNPRAGERVRIAYRPVAPPFANEQRLVLRARLRTPNASAYVSMGVMWTALDTLVRDRRGVYRGSFTLPDSVVFAAIAIENTAASTVDDRDGRAWDVLIHSADGRPMFDALEQREEDLMGRSWEEAYATARRRAELYPALVQSWISLEFYENAVLGKAAADSAAAAREPQLNALIDAYMTSSSVPSAELAAVLWRAYVRGDTAGVVRWLARLEREDPRNPQAVQQIAIRTYWLHQHDTPSRLLGEFENLWEKYGPVSGPGRALIHLALGAAVKAKDASAYQLWAHRAMAENPSTASYYAAEFLRYDELRPEGLALLRGLFAEPALGPRGLGTTRERYSRIVARDRRRTLAAIGRGLLDQGEPRAGLDTLSLAVAEGWDLDLFRLVTEKRLEAGDTLGALTLQAKIAVDPRTTPAEADSISNRGASILGAATWAASVEEARGRMMRETMAYAVERIVPGTPSLRDGLGRSVTLRELILGRPALVVYWSRFCGPALEALPRIEAAAAAIRERGATAVLIVDEPPSDELAAYLREQKVMTRVYHDTDREVAMALKNFGTPAYYVFDPAGRLRFTRASTEGDLVVQVAAVAGEHEMAVTGAH